MDAGRPRSVAKRMHAKMKGTRFEKHVANPNKGSMRNYGIAVDVTIVDAIKIKEMAQFGKIAAVCLRWN
jgi:D-alanyl-D-alanine dipeptidase